MKIRIAESVVLAVGLPKLSKIVGDAMDDDQLSWKNFVEIELEEINLTAVKELRAAIAPSEEVRGAKVVLRDLDTWIHAQESPGATKARKLEHFETLLIEFLLDVPGHRLFRKPDGDGDTWLCYAVVGVEYHAEQKSREYYHPAYVDMDVVFQKLGAKQKTSVSWESEDIQGRTVEKALADKGFFPEIEDRRLAYLAEVERYHATIPAIGKQFLASGVATDDIRDTDYWGKTTVRFVAGETPNRVVVDILQEEGERERRERESSDKGLWLWARNEEKRKKRIPIGDAERIERLKRAEMEKARLEEEARERRRKKKIDRGYAEDTPPDSKDREQIDVEDVEEDTAPRSIEVPVHPYVVIFDLVRHARLSIHVNYLTEYIYDRKLSEKLILPADVKGLVRMLVEHREGSFRDIVAGKSGGAIVLLTGPPGVGKTLTAEVFAEAVERPLYSVQASQLGTSPDELEKELLLVLARAARWKAIMLLDEADVYVHERGNDLQQNAIIGVFLRVLEYHASVLFLTTNRPDLVDDAIASRCVARIDYLYPSSEDQKRIWRVLSGSSAIALPDSVVDGFVERHKDISGRDVKNLLKLASLVAASTGEPISVEGLEYALRFKPTNSISDASRYRTSVALPSIEAVPELPEETVVTVEMIAKVPDARFDAYVRSTTNPRPGEAARLLVGANVDPSTKPTYRAIRRRLNAAKKRASRMGA